MASRDRRAARKRKRRAAARAGAVAERAGGQDSAGPPPEAGDDTANGGVERAGRPLSRSEAKDAAARAALVPLREGERPRAVTVAAIVAFLLGAATLVLYVIGFEIGGERPAAFQALSQAAVMLVAAWGMWRARYWAVLGMQVILAFTILLFSMFVVRAENVPSALIAVAVIAASGTLFWFLVKALARIQMPERRR